MTDLHAMLRPRRARENSLTLGISRSVIVLLAAAGATASLLGLLSYVEPQLDIVANFAPITLAIALALLVSALVIRRALAGVVMATFGLAASGALMFPELLAAVGQHGLPDHPTGRIKVLSANLLSTNLERTKFEDLVRREQPDIILLQEAFGPWRQTLANLATEYQTRAGCSEPHLCNTVVLSRLPAAEQTTSDANHITSVRLRLPANLGGGVVEAVSVHLSRPPPIAAHAAEVDELIALSGLLSSRAIIAGDFNATPWTSAIRKLDGALLLERRTRGTFSWPVPFPVAPVDHVYAGSYWDGVSVRRGPDIGSDHYPIIAELSVASDL